MKLRMLILAALMVPLLTLIMPASPASASPAHDDQIERLYLTVLGREAEPAGLAYWAERRTAGETLQNLTRTFLKFPEVEMRSSGDLVVDAYTNALDRRPDEAGYAYWSQQEAVAAVLFISESVEHQQLTGTLPPPTEAINSGRDIAGTPAADVPDGWVDAGNGVYVPPVLLRIRHCESTDNYSAANRWSSARGAYQFLTKSWEYYGHADRYDAAQADLATPAQQDEAAVLTWQTEGTRPWNASLHCWG